MSRPKKILTFGCLGGTGDVAVFTTLPQRFTAAGYDVYLDADNLTRNPETMDFWYASNPYILGTSTEKPNCGYVLQGAIYTIANRLPLGSGIAAVERAHGLEPPYSLNPVTFYKPKPYQAMDLSNTVLVDMSARSTVITAQGLVEHVTTKMAERFGDKELVMVTFGPGIISRVPELSGSSLRITSIWDYADAIASCHALVCSEAGSQAIAAAIRGGDCFDFERTPQVVSIISNKTYNSNLYAYRANEYRVCSNTSNQGDYWAPAEVPYHNYQILARRSVEEARAEWDAAHAAKEIERAASA